MTTYEEESYWSRYETFFPERFRLGTSNRPDETWWLWRDGRIHLDRYECPGAPVHVLLLHGAGGYGRFLGPLAVMLRARGFSVVAPDLPGYGLSETSAALFTHEAWVDCASDLLAAEVERVNGTPVVLFGISVGGYLAYQVAARTRLAAGVMATTIADPRLQIVRDQFSRNVVLSRIGVPLMRLTRPFAGARVPIRWLSRMSAIVNDPEFSRLVCADRLGGGNRTPFRFLRSLFEMVPDIEPEMFDLCPVLLAQPADDRWTTLEASQPFFNRIKAPKQLVLLENGGHVPVEEPGITQLDDAVTSFLHGIAANRAPVIGD